MRGDSLDIQIAYLHGRIEAQLEAFALSLNISTSELTSRVGALLLGDTSRKTRRTKDPVSTLRGAATERNKASREVEVVSRSPKNSSRKTGSGVKAYWAAMTPEQRSAENRRRHLKRLENAKRKDAKA